MTRTIVCCLLLACLIGCQGPWQAFEEIELGKPVPDKGILRGVGRKGRFEWVWRDGGSRFLPLIKAESTVRILRDEQGNVVAREYTGMAFGHWLLFQSAAWRWVLEVDVPEYAWHDPNGRQSPSADELSKAHERGVVLPSLLFPLRREGPRPHREAIYSTGQYSLEPGTIAKWAFAISRRRVAKRVLDRIDGGQRSVAVDITKDINLDGLYGAKEADWSDVKTRVYVEDEPEPPTLFLEITVPIPTRRPSNVLEWLMYVAKAHDSRLPADPRLSSEPDTSFLAGWSYVVSMFSLNGMTGISALERKPELFHGVTRKGFDRTYTNLWGGKCRIQNLGGRRIRVESNSFDLMDSLMLLGRLKFVLVEYSSMREWEITEQDRKKASAKVAGDGQGGR